MFCLGNLFKIGIMPERLFIGVSFWGEMSTFESNYFFITI